MKDSVKNFIDVVLGPEASQALVKAAERSDSIATALIPRTVVAWLGLASRWGYEGEVPGNPEAYLSFQKSAADNFTGYVKVGPDQYDFRDASLLHLAAALTVALGADGQPVDPRLKVTDVERLGKNIDLLIHARLTGLLKRAKEESSSSEGSSSVEKVEAPGGAAGPHAPTPPGLPTPQKKQPAQQKPKSPTLRITKSQATHECSVCGDSQFANEEFCGCACLRDLAGFAKSQVHQDGFVVTFGPEWAANDIAVLIDMMEEDDNG